MITFVGNHEDVSCDISILKLRRSVIGVLFVREYPLCVELLHLGRLPHCADSEDIRREDSRDLKVPVTRLASATEVRLGIQKRQLMKS
jgi:hypothetical protein